MCHSLICYTFNFYKNVFKIIRQHSPLNFPDAATISSTVNQSRVTTTTPGPSSVSSSGYPPSPAVISLDSPSPPRSPRAVAVTAIQNSNNPVPPFNSGLTNGTATPGVMYNASMASFLDLESSINRSNNYF